MIKICIIQERMGAGGLERVASILANYFGTEKNATVHVVSLFDEPNFYPISQNVTIIKPDFDPQTIGKFKRIVKQIRYVRSSIKHISPDFVLSMGVETNILSLIATRGLTCKHFVSDRNSPSYQIGKLRKTAKKFLYKKSSGIICQTHQAKQTTEQLIGTHNICVIPNPIPTPKNGSATNRENIIINVGRFIESKQQERLIRYFSQLDAPHWQLLLVGDGPLKEQCRQYASQLGVEHRVVFTGNIKNVQEYLDRSKIFAFTSASEGFPNALGEALLTPVASISFDCTAGPKDMISDGENGYLVPMDDDDQYLQKLQRLVQDESIRLRFENNSIQLRQQFSTQNIAQKYYEFITQSHE